MVWMGTFTQSFLPPISAQNARILEQTKQLRVDASGDPGLAANRAEVANAR